MIPKWVAAFFMLIPVASAWLFIGLTHWTGTTDTIPFRGGFIYGVSTLTMLYIIMAAFVLVWNDK